MSSSGSSAIGSVFLAAADVSGIAHPVAGGSVLPGHGDVDMDAEHAGEDGGGEFGGELEQGGGAGWAGAIWLGGACLVCANAQPVDKTVNPAARQATLRVPARGRRKSRMGVS